MSYPAEDNYKTNNTKGFTMVPEEIADSTEKNDEITQLVFEYLEMNGLGKTLSTFVQECRTKSLPFPTQTISVPFMQSDGQKLMKCFDNGDLNGFIQLWKAFLQHIKVTNEDMKKLEVYLRVHFAVFPITNGASKSAQKHGMLELKNYFENDENNFSEDTKMLPLFALPYVAEPFEVPIFRELIEPDWAEKLRYQLETTIFRYFYMIRENTEAHAKYATVLMKAKVNEQKQELEQMGLSSGSSSYYQNRFYQLITTFRKVRRLLRGTRESYGRLLKVSFELICGLEASIAGHTAVLEPVVQNCYEIFPELFTSDSTKNGVPDREYFKHLAAGAFFDSILDSDVSLFFIGISDMSPDTLDYAKIKETLGSEDTCNGNSNKLCLLQALRWLLTRSPNSCKEYAMDAFIACDLLGLSAANDEYRTKLFSCMISKTPTYLKECFIRFLNCFASMKVGRRYLSSSSFIIELMAQALGTFDGQNEKYNCQMIIATFQKLSLRKAMRLGMIDRGVIQWLVNYIKPEVLNIGSTENLSLDMGSQTNVILPLNYNPYLMEYGWALLMNLCLHGEASKPSTKVGRDMIKCAIKMLRIRPTADVAPYVVSTLYSLVQNPSTFPIAVELNVARELVEIVNRGIKDVEGQLGSIIRILQGKEQDEDRHQGEIDYDDDEHNDQDEFETEIEVPETWVKALDANAMVGDDLLARKYILQKTIIEPVLPNSPPSTNRSFNRNEVIMRPTTPSKMGRQKSNQGNPVQPKSSKPKRSGLSTKRSMILEPSEQMPTFDNEPRTILKESKDLPAIQDAQNNNSVMMASRNLSVSDSRHNPSEGNLTSRRHKDGKGCVEDHVESAYSGLSRLKHDSSLNNNKTEITSLNDNSSWSDSLNPSTKMPEASATGEVKKKKKLKMRRQLNNQVTDLNGRAMPGSGANSLNKSAETKQRHEGGMASAQHSSISKGKSKG